MPFVAQPEASDIRATLQLIVQRARVLTRGSSAALALAHKGLMICQARAGDAAPPLGSRLDVLSGFSAECIRTGKALRCDDSECNPLVDAQTCHRIGIRSILAAPVMFDGHVVGLLEVFSPQRFAFHDEHLAVVERLAQVVFQPVSRPPSANATPPPKLVVELEPAHRVFCRNLGDILRARRAAPLRLTSLPAPFWPDVFVPSPVPWEGLFQSVALHVMMIAVLGSLLQLSLFERHPLRPRVFDKSQVIYYLPAEYAPLLARAAPRVARKEARGPAKHAAMSVARESNGRAQAVIKPPEIKLKHDLRSLQIISLTPVVPAVPLSATTRNQLITPPSLVSAIEPPPEVSAVSTRRGLAPPASSVIAPPPSLQPSIRQMDDIHIGKLAVVAPAPQMPAHLQSSIWASAKATLASAVTAIVPPPPSGKGLASFGRQSTGPSPAGTQVVPPPPLIRTGGNFTRGTGEGTRLAVVPPPPSVNGLANPGRQAGGHLPSGAVPVVPPPPLIRTAGNFTRSTGEGTSLQVVPPPPSVNGLANPSRQAGNRPPSSDVQVVPPPPAVRVSGWSRRGASDSSAPVIVPPPPSVGAAASNGFGNRARQTMSSVNAAALPAMLPAAQRPGNTAVSSGNVAPISPASAVLPPLDVPGDPEAGFPREKELSVNLIGPELPLPSSSYFSSQEVFLAEEQLSRHESRLIKLVYEFLPYQPRLSEYGPNYPALEKLRVIRDPSCDETVTLATPSRAWSQGELACYRTTADDYRRARARQHR